MLLNCDAMHNIIHIMPLSIVTFNIEALGEMTLRIRTLSID